FASIAAVEGINYIWNKRLIPLSTQKLVDCDTGNRHCDGGYATVAFQYIMENGITTDNNYPYEDKYGNFCQNRKEKEMRFSVFKETAAHVTRFNSRRPGDDHDQTYTMELSQFADWTPSEFRRRRCAIPHHELEQGNDYDEMIMTTEAENVTSSYGNMNHLLPKEVNWVKRGAVTSVKSYKFISPNYKNKPAVRIDGYYRVRRNNERALMIAVARQPVVALIEASPDFRHYSKGVFAGECGTVQDHAVTIVGYGTTPCGIPYWLVKNSWGPQWGGEGGYIRMRPNVSDKRGLCGIAMEAYYPYNLKFGTTAFRKEGF
ncbi:hypothetical protein MIMGU_mgv1a025633mg, partial [Erythranthe guttata]